MYRLIPVVLLALCAALVCTAQTAKSDIAEIERFVDNIPKNNTTSTLDLAGTLKAYGFRKEAGLRGCFYWIMKNIGYDRKDVQYMTEDPNAHSSIIKQVLSKRATVCYGYSLLFNRLAQELGYRSYVVVGYTKQNGQVELYDCHAWVAIKMDTGWYMFDPTWARRTEDRWDSANVEYDYFKVKPEDFTKTHMPLDPMWQFRHYPVSHKEFLTGTPAKPAEYFSYEDTVDLYFIRDAREQRTNELKRALRSDHFNDFLIGYIHSLQAYLNNPATDIWVCERIKQDNKQFAAADSLFREGYNKCRNALSKLNIYNQPASEQEKETIKKNAMRDLDGGLEILKSAVSSMDEVAKQGGAWRVFLENKQFEYNRHYQFYLTLKNR